MKTSLGKRLSAICHDTRTLISGVFINSTAFGGELISSAHQESPAFPLRANVFLNLLDEKTGKTFTFQAQLRGLKRQQGQWIYKISWESRDENP